jgi:hypothetical protein
MTTTAPAPEPRSRRYARMQRPRWVRNGWFATRYLLGSYAVTYPVLRLAPAPYARVMVEREHEVCIEGLPRSANTFGGWAFLDQNADARLAHHMHVPQQAVRSVRLGVPCAVLVREPIGNLTSLVIAGENDLSHDLAYRVFIHYHRKVATVRDRIVVCTFDEVLDDPSVIARRLNNRFGTTFVAEPFTATDKDRIVEGLERNERELGSRPAHATVPSQYKESLKPAVRGALAAHPMLPAARAAYAALADTATRED